MGRKLHALLVGINHYPSPVAPLRGCVNDVWMMRDYLAEWIASEEYELHPLVLVDEQATREAVIAGFERHLVQAGPEDAVLFYFSGHGAQERVPPEFWGPEPARLDETIVCYDSRLPGGWDLSHRELSTLLARVSDRGPQITVILDCSYTRSGTRAEVAEIAVRTAGLDERFRPWESYCFVDPAASSGSEGGINPSGGYRPAGTHYRLSSSQDFQLAKETDTPEGPRGVFSWSLLETLKLTGGSINYANLLARSRALVTAHVADQFPQLELVGGVSADSLFLNGALRTPHRSWFVCRNASGDWVVQAGHLHGIPQPDGREHTELLLYPFEASEKIWQGPRKAIGRVRVKEIFPTESTITFIEEPAVAAESYRAILCQYPLTPLRVRLEGTAEGVRLARQAIEVAGGKNTPSLFVREIREREFSGYRLIASQQGYLVTLPEDDRPFLTQIEDHSFKNEARTSTRELLRSLIDTPLVTAPAFVDILQMLLGRP